MKIRLNTLTPLYTGGVDAGMDHVHETGIIGSLRWWYEAIVRGQGGDACDPTAHKCELTGDRFKHFQGLRARGKDWWSALDQVGICDVCKVFGTTGWRRRFRLCVAERQGKAAWDESTIVNIRPYGRERGWYLPPGWTGTLTLDVSGDPVVVGRIASLFLFLEEWGSLGAKPQLGYGTFRFENREDVRCWVRSLTSPSSVMRENAQIALPSLRTMTFFHVRFVPRSQAWWEDVDGLRQLRRRKEWNILQDLAEKGLMPVGPTIKNRWRYTRSWPSPHLKPWLFGTLRRDYRMRSKINIGWAVRQNDNSWLIKGWIWLPRDSVSSSGYITLLNTIRKLVEDESEWLEALNLRGMVHGLKVTMYPTDSPWGVKKALSVQTWLNVTLGGQG